VGGLLLSRPPCFARWAQAPQGRGGRSAAQLTARGLGQRRDRRVASAARSRRGGLAKPISSFNNYNNNNGESGGGLSRTEGVSKPFDRVSVPDRSPRSHASFFFFFLFSQRLRRSILSFASHALRKTGTRAQGGGPSARASSVYFQPDRCSAFGYRYAHRRGHPRHRETMMRRREQGSDLSRSGST
jgi:hypothetical protein